MRKKQTSEYKRIYHNFLLIGVLKRLASWNRAIFTRNYRSTSTQPGMLKKSNIDQVSWQRICRSKIYFDDYANRTHYLAMSPLNMFSRTVSAMSSALCPVTSLSTFKRAAPRSRALYRRSITIVRFDLLSSLCEDFKIQIFHRSCLIKTKVTFFFSWY